MDIQALVAELPVEALDEAVLDGLAGPNEDQLDAVLVGPLVQGAARALRAVVEHQPAGIRAALCRDPIEDPSRARARERCVDFDRQTLTGRVVAHVEDAERATAGQGIQHEIHGPLGVRPDRHHAGPPVGFGDALALLPAYGQPEIPVHAVDAFVIQRPALSYEQDIEASVAEAGPLGGQLLQALAKTPVGFLTMPAASKR